LGGAAALLAASAWPGARAAEGQSASAGVSPVRFVVANDMHHEDVECDAWMAALFRQIAATEQAVACFGLGDLANRGSLASLQSMKRLSELAGMPFLPCPGNHDLDESPVDGHYGTVFPGRRNYVWRHAGWQFVVLDSTEGAKFQDVEISKDTLDWLDDTLPDLDPAAPLVIGTHFPLAAEVRMCPVNADAVLARFIGHNLRGVFGGHFTAAPVRRAGRSICAPAPALRASAAITMAPSKRATSWWRAMRREICGSTSSASPGCERRSSEDEAQPASGGGESQHRQRSPPPPAHQCEATRGEREREGIDHPGPRDDEVPAKPDAQIEHHPHHRGRHRTQRRRQPGVIARALHPRGAREDEQKARKKRHPRGERGRGDGHRPRRQATRISPAGEEPDELQRPGSEGRGWFPQGPARPSSLPGREPAVDLHGLLPDVRRARRRPRRR
jgi:hypothetical protein